MTEADQEKELPPDLILGNAAMCQPRRMVVNHHNPRDHRCIPGLTGQQLFMKRDLIPHDVVTDPGQFIAQGLGRHDRISLGSFSVIITFKPSVVPASKLSGFDKCPAEIFITIFTVPFAFALAIGKAL